MNKLPIFTALSRAFGDTPYREPDGALPRDLVRALARGLLRGRLRAPAAQGVGTGSPASARASRPSRAMACRERHGSELAVRSDSRGGDAPGRCTGRAATTHASCRLPHGLGVRQRIAVESLDLPVGEEATAEGVAGAGEFVSTTVIAGAATCSLASAVTIIAGRRRRA